MSDYDKGYYAGNDAAEKRCAAKLAGRWQPIEAAPLVNFGDTPVYVLLSGASIGVCTGRACRYSDGYVFAGVAHVNGNLAGTDVTHFMPLPDPPVPTGAPAVVTP